MKSRLLVVAATILLVSCEMIDYHPYDGRLNTDEREINNTQIARIESATQDKDIIRFILMGDTQRSYDETKDFVTHVNHHHGGIDFVIHGGDQADFGMNKEYEWCHEVMSGLRYPYVTLIGNHDIIGNGDQIYEKLYGADNFSFIAGDTKFLCLNTNAIEYDYSHAVPDFTFLKNELNDTASYSKTVVAMHAPPGNEQFNNNVKDIFQAYITRFPNLQFCLHAHIHQVTVSEPFNDGVLYYSCANMAKRSYLLFTLTPKGYTYEVVDF